MPSRTLSAPAALPLVNADPLRPLAPSLPTPPRLPIPPQRNRRACRSGRGEHRGSGHRGGEGYTRCTAACEGAKALQQFVTHGGTGARQALAHRRIAEPEQAGHLLRALALAVVQQQDLAAVVGQRGHDLQRGALFFHLQGLFGRRGRRVGGHCDGQIRRLTAQWAMPVATQPVARQVAGNLPQPGQEAGRLMQLRQPLPRTQECFLRNVLAGRYIARDRQRDGGDRVLAGSHDAAVRLLTTRRGVRQFVVEHRVQGVGVHRRNPCPGTSMTQLPGECDRSLRQRVSVLDWFPGAVALLSYGRQIDRGIVATSCDDQRAPRCQAMRIGACAADWPRANQLAGWMRTRVWSSSAAGACGVFAGAGCAAGVAAGASGAAR